MIIRIANIIEEGKLGGPQIRMVMVADALKDRVETTIIMPEENSEPFRRLCEKHQITSKIFPLSRITKEWRVALRYLLFSVTEIFQLKSFFKKNNFDLVHVSGGSWQYKGVIAGKLAGKKVIWHLNDTSMPGFIRVFFSFISHMADGFIFASERSMNYYRPLIKKSKPEFVIQAPVDTQQFDPEGKYSGDEKILKEWEDKIVIGTTANINPIKGLEIFINAAAKVNQKIDNIQFVIVGPVFKNQQRYFKNLQRLCEKLSLYNIKFAGVRSDVRPILNRFDIYVCSSRAESSPISVWEAMSMRKPIVSTDVGDVPLYIRDGYNGFIVKTNNAKSLGERLELLAKDANMRKAFGKRSREIAIQELDIKQCTDRHFTAYYNLNFLT